MAAERFDLVGIGVAVRDITLRLDPFPAPDSKVQARELSESGGGPVPTAMVTVSRLGGRAAWAGPLGGDAAADLIAASMADEGVDLRGAVRRAGPSPASVILVEPGGGRRICEWRQQELPFGPEDLAPVEPLLEAAAVLLVDGRYPEAQSAAAERVHRAGGLVAMDCGHPRPGADRLLPRCDIAILSHSYARAAQGAWYDPEGFVRELAATIRREGPAIAGVTLGAEGCLVAAGRSEPLRLPALSMKAGECVDTTGAGDVFHGAFLLEWIRTSSAEAAARFATAAAGLSCRGLTGRAPLPAADTIRSAGAELRLR